MRPKPRERKEARALRMAGFPMKRIAARLGVSPASVYLWTKDIELTPVQIELIREANRPALKARAAAWRERNQLKRLAYQEQGRARARLGEPLHQAGCMLYWAEGTKNRNSAQLVNSDVHLVRFFVNFIRQTFGVASADFTISLNVYLGNGLSVKAIETFWLTELRLPRSCLRKHQLDHTPTSSSGRKKGKLPNGVCTVRVKRSTWLVQHIYGAIQEYAGFDEPAWLDCTPATHQELKLPT